MKKQIFSLLFAMLILFSIPVTAYAHDVPDITREDCSIALLLRDKATKQGITDAELVIIRVGYVDDDGDGNYFFYDVTTREVIEKIQSPDTAEKLHDAIKSGAYTEEYKVTSVDKDGTYHFEGLKTGLYLVVQEKAPEGYGDMSPFLVSVPYMLDGKYEYHVTADIKTELEKVVETTEPEPTKPTGKLPQTGQLNWPVPLLASSGIVVFALGYMLRFGRRKEDYEE